MVHYPKFMVAIAALAAAIAVPSSARPPIEPAPPPPDVPIALLVDLSSGQTLYAREPDRRFMPASITKVMTAYAAFQMIGARQVKTDQLMMVSDRAFKDWHGVGSTMFLAERQRVSVDSLLRGVTTVSANDGAAVLGEGLVGSLEKWTAQMNAEARALGMANSHFGTPNGWMDEGRTFVTARDLTTLAEAIVTRHPDLYRQYFGKKLFAFNGFQQRNHDPVTGVVDGADGIKTGFTNQAGYGFLGSAERGGRRLVMVIAGAPTARIQHEASRAFLEWGFAQFESRPLFATNAPVGSARVQDGAARSVGLVAMRPVGYTLPRGETGKVRLSIRYDGPLRAPIRQGKKVADLEISVDGARPTRVPLAAATSVGEANGLQRVVNGVLGIF